mgnify:CR=1 FL=1|tara:strand:- start:4333 stop:5973 length:1641 start_codon:yes stop_codon:yes gene_type:complete
MNLRFVRLFIFSIGNFILEKIKKIYFTTKYYNNSLKFSPPSRSYDMNNVPLLLELEDKNTKRKELLDRFQKNIWKLDNIGEKNISELHKFNWISQLDIKKQKNFAKTIILEWLNKNQNYNEKNWSHQITSCRIIFWICCSHFTIRHDDMVYRAAVTNSIVKQAIHLNKNLSFINNKLDKIFALTALILVSVTFEGNQKLFQISIKNLSNEIKNIIDRNGFVESKNPEDQFWLLHHLILIREFLIFSQNTVPEFLDLNIEKIGSNYKGLLFSNNSLPLFNGCKQRDTTEFNKFLKVKNYKFEKKTKTHAYLISKIKKYEIILDANNPPSDFNSKNYQAGCLSFEFLYSGKKVISNCGSANNFNGELPYLSQTTAAHSTLTINDTSSCQFQKNSLVRTYYGNSLIRKLKVYKKDLNFDKDTISIIAGHNGYQKNYNTMYERKILVKTNEDKLIGDELIVVAKKDLVFLNFALRFHIMPGGKLVQTQGGDVLLSVDNQGWKFKSSHTIKIEDSLFFAFSDKVSVSKCILVEGTLKDKVNSINWSLEKTN